MSRQVKRVNIGGKEDKSNKVTSISSLSTNIQYPSAKAVYDEIWTDLYGTIQSDYVQSNDLSSVAFSNDYNDLDNLPQLGDLAYANDVDLSGHDLDELSDNTNLLFSGDYEDLDNKPTIPSVNHTHTKSQITDLPTTFENGAIYVEGTNADSETTTDTFKATLPLSSSQIVDGLKLIYKVSVTSTNSTSDLRLQLGLSNQTNESYIRANNTFTTANLYPRSTLLFLVRLNGDWHIVGTSTLENSNNKVTSWSSTTTDAHYPSEKLVKDSLDGKADSTHTHTSLQKTTITSGNLDDYTDTGWYSYSTTNSSSITNTPENVGSVMEVFDNYGDGKYIVQKVYTLPSDNNSIIYYRQKYNTSWGDWERIIDTGDASTTAPVANRVASSATTGSSTKYARADHSHTLTQFKCNGTAGSNGYIKVFQIKINGTYQDSPISFSLMQRGTKQSAVVNIRFANENNNDPTLDSFTFSGSNIGNNGEYYLYKESASTWSFIVRKWDTHDVINIYNMSTTNGSVAVTSLNTQVSELPSGCIPAIMVRNDLFFKTKNGSTSNYINLFEIRPTGDYQAKPITFEIVRNTKPTPVYVSVRLTNVTLASNTYSPQTIWSWGTSDTPVYIRKEANNVFNVIVGHVANEEISVCNMNNPNQNVKITPLGTVYGTDAPATSGDNQVWRDTYTVGGTTFGTGTNNVIRGNDSRLSDTRNPKSTKISAGSDLNTYTTTGFYYNNANSDCATITPLPQPNKAFFLQVEDWGTSNYTKQTITHYDPVKTYERIRNSGTWTGWYELQHNDGTGGENLIRTEPNNEGNSGVAYTIADETFHNDKVYYRNETSKDTTKYSGWQWAIPRTEFDYGDVFTLSFYAKGTNGAEIRTYFAGASGYISNRRISSNSDVDADKTIGSYGDGATRFHLTSDWKKYYVTYQLHTTATTPTQNKSIHIRTFGASTDIESYISNVKLERGYYATDYDRHTRDNEPLYFPTEVSLPTTTTNANRRKFIHPPYKFKNVPNWTVEGELKVTGNAVRFDLHKVGDTTAQNFIAIGKNTGGNLAYWWSTGASTESSKTYDASHIAVDTWYPFRISRMGNNVLFMFNNTDKYELTTTYFNTIDEVEPTLYRWTTSGASVRNLKITPLEPVHPLSPNSSVCTNAQGIITTESKNNHTHSDTQLNWNGGAMVNSSSPLDMVLNEELSPNRLAYLDGNNIDVDYSTDGGSTWTSYGASATEKSKLVTTSQTFVSGKGATASSNNQLRITIHSGLTSDVISQIYVITRKLMIYYSTGGGSGNKVKIQTNTYGSPDTWTDVKEYNIGGYSGWNSFPLNITFGGFANQTNTTRIKSIRLIFTCTSNHNFNVQKIRLYGENCYVAQSDYAKTGHIYTVDINKNTTFPAKIIKSGGTSSQFLMANGDVGTKVTSISSSSTDDQFPSAKCVYDGIREFINTIYPVGSIYISANEVSPTTLFGGTWVKIQDRFLLGAGDTYANESTGGSATVTLTSAQSGVPAHSHKYQDYNTTYTLKTTNRKPGTSTAVAYGTSLTAGGGATERTSSNNTAANASQAHENMPPYFSVGIWKKISNNTPFFIDKGVRDSSNIFNFGDIVQIESSNSANKSQMWNAFNGIDAYKFNSTGTGTKFFPITALNGKSRIRLAMELYVPSSSVIDTVFGFGVATTQNDAVVCNFSKSATVHTDYFNNGTFENTINLISDVPNDKWYYCEMIVDNDIVTMNVYNNDNVTVIFTDTITLSEYSNSYSTLANRRYGITIGYADGSIGYARYIEATEL